MTIASVTYYHFSLNSFGLSGPMSLAKLAGLEIASESFFKECYLPYIYYYFYSVIVYGFFITSFFTIFFNITCNVTNKLAEIIENKYEDLNDFRNTYDNDIAVYFNSLHTELNKFSLLICFPLIPLMFLKTLTKITYASFAHELLYALALSPVFLALALILFLIYQYNNFFNDLETVAVNYGLGFSTPELEKIQEFRSPSYFYKFMSKSNLALPMVLALINFIYLNA